MKRNKYPASFLYTMVTELLREMDLPYTVADVYTFGYVPSRESDFGDAVFVEVFTRNEYGEKTGTERIVRYVDRDVSYTEWASPKPQRDYLNFVVG